MIYEKIKKNSIDIKIYMYGRDKDLKPGIVYGPVIRECYVIECCTGGKSIISINGQEFNIKSGDCYVLLPGDVIIHKNDEKYSREGVWCGIGGLKVKDYFKKIGVTSTSPFISKELFETVKNQIENILSIKDEHDAGSELRRLGCIYTLLGEILKFIPKSDNSNDHIEKALDIIETKYNENISVSTIANDIGLERSYFSTLFKEKTGKTPHAFIMEYRIKKACAFLETNNFSTVELANAVGIEPENFARVFKKFTGKTIKEYKKSQIIYQAEF